MSSMHASGSACAPLPRGRSIRDCMLVVGVPSSIKVPHTYYGAIEISQNLKSSTTKGTKVPEGKLVASDMCSGRSGHENLRGVRDALRSLCSRGGRGRPPLHEIISRRNIFLRECGGGGVRGRR